VAGQRCTGGLSVLGIENGGCVSIRYLESTLTGSEDDGLRFF